MCCTLLAIFVLFVTIIETLDTSKQDYPLN